MDKMQQIKSYLNRGWGLTPVGAPKDGNENSGKNPFLPGWTKNPVRNMETAKTYWDNDKGYNVGVMTGEISGLVVLDIDYPEVFDRFLEKFPECRNTYIVRRNNAPDWKCHYYFKLDGFTPPSHNVKTTGWGDLMCNGKQVVAPPSVHYTGGVYEVVNDVEPLPFKKEYLANLLLALPKGKKKVAKEEKDILFSDFGSGVPEGERNNMLFKFLQRLRKEGTTIEEARAAALDFCQECDPPYDEVEALKTVESVFSYNISPKRKKTLSQLNYYREGSTSDEGETQYKVKPLPFNEVSDRIAGLLDGEVANVYGELVLLPRSPEDDAVSLKTTADLFALLGNTFKDVPDWKKGQNYMTKEELFSSLKVMLPNLQSIEKVPELLLAGDEVRPGLDSGDVSHYPLGRARRAESTVPRHQQRRQGRWQKHTGRNGGKASESNSHSGFNPVGFGCIDYPLALVGGDEVENRPLRQRSWNSAEDIQCGNGIALHHRSDFRKKTLRGRSLQTESSGLDYDPELGYSRQRFRQPMYPHRVEETFRERELAGEAEHLH